jgi:hypothetical protein
VKTLKTVSIDIEEREDGKLGYAYKGTKVTLAEALVLISGAAALVQSLVAGFGAIAPEADVVAPSEDGS